MQTRAVEHAEYGPPDVLRIASGTVPAPGPGEVCIRVRAAAINPKDVPIPLAGQTALQALRDLAGVGAGAAVWIHGASGGVGTFAIQIARILGTFDLEHVADAHAYVETKRARGKVVISID